MDAQVLDDTLNVVEVPGTELMAEIETTETSKVTRHDKLYCHSKAYTSKVNLNPLVAAASPIFTILAVKKAQVVSDVTQLHHSLDHEIRAFENKAGHQGYNSKIIFAGRYVLSAYIDDIILTTSWGRRSNWKDQSILASFKQEVWPGEQFFTLLERCSDEPELYIDLLELMYLCLSLGYEGHYRHLERGHADLDATFDNLYHTIRTERGDLSKNLQIIVKQQQAVATRTRKLPIGFMVIVLVTIMLIAGSFGLLSHLLTTSLSPALQILQTS